MKAKLLPLFGLTGLLLQACAHPPALVAPAQEPADEAGRTAQCGVDPNPVKADAAGAVPVKMTVGNDGGWCAVRMAQVKTAVVRARPQHGMVYFRNVRDISRLQYTPAQGYAGPDGFTFQVYPSGTTIPTAVTVTGSAATRAPAAATPAVGRPNS